LAVDGERGDDTGLALHRDAAAVRLDDLADDPQPEPEAAVVLDRCRSLEPLEDPRLVAGGNADPVVLDAQTDTISVGRLDVDEDGLLRAEFGCARSRR
jgi:hypothetical protein